MGCSKTLTAQELGISRSTLWRKLRQIRSGQLIRLGARTATTAIGLARARGPPASKSEYAIDMPGIVWLASEKRECGQKSSAEKERVGSERKGTPDEAGMSQGGPASRKGKGGACRCLTVWQVGV
ncbi:MAG: helix-turn-helix domain-containing protein [Bilophila wadsworthia]